MAITTSSGCIKDYKYAEPNPAKDKGFYIDHAYRNAIEHKKNRTIFIYCAIFFVAVTCIGLIWHLYHYVKWRMGTTKAMTAKGA